MLMKASSDHDRIDKDYSNNEELAAQCARALRNLSLNRKYTFVSACLLFCILKIFEFKFTSIIS